MVSVEVEGRSQGWGMHGRDFDCSTTCALELPSREPSSGADRAELGRWVEVPEVLMAFSSRITMATGTSQRACHCALPGPASAGQEEGELAWLRAVGRGPRVGQPGLDAASRLYVGHLPAHTPLLGTDTEQTGQKPRKKRRGLQQLDRGREEHCQPGAWKQDQRHLYPGARQP